jgi:hypothetical protein
VTNALEIAARCTVAINQMFLFLCRAISVKFRDAE